MQPLTLQEIIPTLTIPQRIALRGYGNLYEGLSKFLHDKTTTGIQAKIRKYTYEEKYSNHFLFDLVALSNGSNIHVPVSIADVINNPLSGDLEKILGTNLYNQLNPANTKYRTRCSPEEHYSCARLRCLEYKLENIQDTVSVGFSTVRTILRGPKP